MINADEMKKLAFEKKKELSKENINIEKINNVILDKAEKGETCVEFYLDTSDEIYHPMVDLLYEAIKEKSYIYQSFIERGFKIETKRNRHSYSIFISWD